MTKNNSTATWLNRKAFAVLLPLLILNYQVVGTFFLNKQVRLLIPNKKVSFDRKGSSFNCSYFCKDFLPKDIVFTELAHSNAGKYFLPSRMYKDLSEDNSLVLLEEIR